MLNLFNYYILLCFGMTTSPSQMAFSESSLKFVYFAEAASPTTSAFSELPLKFVYFAETTSKLRQVCYFAKQNPRAQSLQMQK